MIFSTFTHCRFNKLYFMTIKKSVKLSTLLISAVIGAGLLMPTVSLAQSAATKAATIAALQAKLQALQAQINTLRAPNRIVPMPVPTIPIEPIDDSDFEDIVQFNNLIIRGVSGPSFPAEIRASYEVGVRCQKFQSESASGLEYPCPLSPSVLYTIKVDSDTRLLLRNRQRASLASFEVGDRINVYGFTDSGVSSIDAIIVRNLTKPVRLSFVQLNNMEALSAPSSGVPPASFTVVNKYFSPCRDFSDNPSGVILPCPLGLEIQEQVQLGAGAMEASSAYYPLIRKYLIEVTSQTTILQRDRSPMALFEIAVGDVLNIYGSYTDSSQNIKALVIRDLSRPAKNRGSLQVSVNGANVVCMLGQQTSSQQIQSGDGTSGGHSDGRPSIVSPCGTIYHATVDLYSASGALIGTQTTERGAAFFENVLAGEYTIVAGAKGYDKTKWSVSIEAGKVAFATIYLSPLFPPPFPTPIPFPTPFPTPPPINNQTPVISGVKGPTSLKVGETGTWSVNAYDPENGPLYYWVIWGDEITKPMPVPSPVPLSSVPVQQTATFTHSYANSGIYVPVFYITDNQGLSAKTSISVNVGETTPQPLGRLYIEVDTDNGFIQTSDAIKVDVGQSRRVRAMYQPPMPPCPGGPAGGVCLEIMPVPQEVSAHWTSSNPNVAVVYTVSNTCPQLSPEMGILSPCDSKILEYVQGISAGTAEIKALYAPYPNAYTATAKVSVVTPSTQPSITVTSPNGGEQWPVGSTQVIKWSPAPVLSCTSNTPCVADQADVDIYLVPERPTCLDAIPACKIMERAPILIARVSDTGLYNWNINASEGKYKIQVNRGTTLDQSDALFSIVSIVSPATKFQIGDRIKTTAKINVRRIPSLSNFISPILGTQAIGALGTVLTSSLSTLVTTYPAYVNDYWWWNVNFDSGVDGWVTENYLEIVATLGLVPNSSQTASIFEAMKAALLEMSKTLNSLR
ncbi:MAG: Serine/threonine protein kinase [Parcubacteria group bacterium GW2011_GWA2_45_30]|nr:MAG: Serine/threonine protein kinase [Parcubacteria group bacterium GW2011_GWA2_45_30]